METRVEVFLKKGINNSEAEGIKSDIQDLGIKKVREVITTQIYLIEGEISPSQKRLICENLLADHLIQEYHLNSKLKTQNSKLNPWIVEVWLKKGVTDTVAESAAKGIRDLGIKKVKNVKTGKKYLLFGSLSLKEIEIICQRLLVNKVIQNYFIK